MMLRLIALEEHFVSDTLRDYPYAARLGLDLFPPEVSRKLLSLQTERLEDMDEAGVAIQVVSHNPGPGALISNHAEGYFFDDESYWPVFDKAHELDVPIYLHPTFPDQAQASKFQGNFSEAAAEAMSAYAWGWHSDVGLHFVRLFASGLFDRYPRLKLILGHMGEMTLFMIERIQKFCPRWGKRQRSLVTVWAENVWFTTSGMFTLGPLACLLRTTTVDKILFSVDYPFEKNRDGRRFIEDV